MNRLLTLTTGGLFAAMAILPVAAFAGTSAAPPADSKAPAAVTSPAETKMAPAAEAKGEVKGHKVETKTEASGGAMKHEGTVKAPASQSSVQPKPADHSTTPGKS